MDNAIFFSISIFIGTGLSVSWVLVSETLPHYILYNPMGPERNHLNQYLPLPQKRRHTLLTFNADCTVGLILADVACSAAESSAYRGTVRPHWNHRQGQVNQEVSAAWMWTWRISDANKVEMDSFGVIFIWDMQVAIKYHSLVLHSRWIITIFN